MADYNFKFQGITITGDGVTVQARMYTDGAISYAAEAKALPWEDYDFLALATESLSKLRDKAQGSPAAEYCNADADETRELYDEFDEDEELSDTEQSDEVSEKLNNLIDLLEEKLTAIEEDDDTSEIELPYTQAEIKEVMDHYINMLVNSIKSEKPKIPDTIKDLKCPRAIAPRANKKGRPSIYKYVQDVASESCKLYYENRPAKFFRDFKDRKFVIRIDYKGMLEFAELADKYGVTWVDGVPVRNGLWKFDDSISIYIAYKDNIYNQSSPGMTWDFKQNYNIDTVIPWGEIDLTHVEEWGDDV